MSRDALRRGVSPLSNHLGEQREGKKMNRHKYIRISATTSFECGRQYGEQAKREIHKAINDYKLLFSETSDKSWMEISDFAISFSEMIRDTMPDLLDEAQGIAVGANVSFSDIMVLNCRYEITKFPKAKECTSRRLPVTMVLS